MNDQTEIDTGTALAIPEGRSLAAMFSQPSQVDDLISRLEAEALSHAPDLTTAKGRKAIASLAYRVAQSKTALDKAGKGLTDDARAQIAVVDAERRKIRERLDALKEKVRAPLDEWEAAEEARVQALSDRLDRLRTAHSTLPDDATSDQIKALLNRVEATAIDDTWAEFIAEAAQYKDQALATLRDMNQRAETREAEQAELARLRAEAEAREKADRERAAAEAAERQRVEAEKAEAERQARYEREKQEAAERAAREANERAKAEAERAAKETAEREAEYERQLAASKAREEAAAQAERDRIAATQRAEDQARQKREADAAHRANIKHQIMSALEPMVGKHPAKDVATALMDGRIPHTRVNL
jgi:hypothetical protein